MSDEVNTLRAPYNLLAEEAVIGSLMLDRDAVIKVAAYLKPEDFHTERLGKIYGAIVGMYHRRVPADPVLLYEELTRTGLHDDVGGMAYVMDVTTRTPTAAHIRYYAHIVVEAAVRRALLRAGGDIAGLAFSSDAGAADLMGRAQKELADLYTRHGSDEGHNAEQLADAFLTRLEGLDPALGQGLLTGYTALDHMTGGFYAGQLIVIAGRPGTGKSSLAANIADRVLRSDDPPSVSVFSLEMTRDEWFAKHISLRTGVSTDRFRQAESMNEQEIKAVMNANGALSSVPLHIDDKADLHISDLLARARRQKAERGLDLLIVDYLQLVKGTRRKDGNRAIEVGEVARGLKEAAKELECPVIALAQLNREIENRPQRDRVPQLSDLRESGEIEQAADIVIMLHHDEQREKTVDLHIRKHRNGPTGVIGLYWDAECTRFENLAYGRD